MSDEQFEAWWRERQKATWRPLAGDPEQPPEQWGAAFKPDAELAWQAAYAAGERAMRERAAKAIDTTIGVGHESAAAVRALE